MRIFDRLSGLATRTSAEAAVDARRATLAILIAFLAPALLIYAGFTIYPVVRTFYNAFHTIKPQGVVEFVGLDNCRALVFAVSTFWKAVVNTAACEAKRMSAYRAITKPRPAQAPLIAAMIGLGTAGK